MKATTEHLTVIKGALKVEVVGLIYQPKVSYDMLCIQSFPAHSLSHLVLIFCELMSMTFCVRLMDDGVTTMYKK